MRPPRIAAEYSTFQYLKIYSNFAIGMRALLVSSRYEDNSPFRHGRMVLQIPIL